jgi:hypothetical protein
MRGKQRQRWQGQQRSQLEKGTKKERHLKTTRTKQKCYSPVAKLMRFFVGSTLA